MRKIRNWIPFVLLAGLGGAVLLAIVMSEAGASTAKVTAQHIVLEPRGPKPKILYPPPRDFENLPTKLAQTEARQEVALARYRMIYRSYLRWRNAKMVVSGPETQFILQPVRVHCTALNITTPPNWCWYAHAARWTERELNSTRTTIKEIERKTLPDTNDWVTAVRIVQRVYPGTERWLLSCSDAEGGHGRWVWYGGRSWQGRHIGNDFLGADTVGGWMQFRYSTFKPYWLGYWGAEGALADTKRRGFIVPDMGTGYAPWLRPLAQALTAGYMKYTGRSGHHWDASISAGCG